MLFDVFLHKFHIWKKSVSSDVIQIALGQSVGQSDGNILG